MNCPKVALIAGASRGVGAAVARSLAAHSNMRIMINYHQNQDAAKQLISEMEHLRTQSGRDVKDSSQRSPIFAAAQADITNRAEMTRLVQQTVEQMGSLDIVISNVGWTRMTDFMNIADADNEEDWDRCFEVNVKSHFRLFRACQAHLESSEGSFIATASVAGVKPSGSSLPYAVTKAALIHLIKSLAIIAGPRIRVNSVAPGVLMTDWGKTFSPEKIQGVQDKNVLRRLATPEDVAEQIRFLAMSSSITGVNTVIDAGFSL
ncbi:short chain dehydrogenase [Talaromyces pinophilus]|uniref:Short chain dehydrogenase n=1 Tax=Talaromyces pinophilus TaxID=128442 RepID=A0A6V8GYP8_TALPI|nr:short chain dehydrogenase [Talaromyces pinophilus]